MRRTVLCLHACAAAWQGCGGFDFLLTFDALGRTRERGIRPRAPCLKVPLNYLLWSAPVLEVRVLLPGMCVCYRYRELAFVEEVSLCAARSKALKGVLAEALRPD